MVQKLSKRKVPVWGIGDMVLQSLPVDYIWSSTGVHSWPRSVYFLYKWFINPFAPKLPVTAHTGPRASTSCDIISFNDHGQLVTANLCKVKRSFKPYQNEHNSVKDTGEKGKKPCNIDLKISMKILFHYPPTFPYI